MLNLENTEEVLNSWGADIVKFAKINIGDRSRTRISKTTGKKRKGKIDSTGNLRNSLGHNFKVNKNSFTVAVTGANYALDIDTGAKRNTTVSEVKAWMKRKPVRLTSKRGFVKMTPARINNFAKFVAHKVSTIGSDRTNYLTDAIKMASKKYEQELVSALFKDTETTVGIILRGLENGNRNNSN